MHHYSFKSRNHHTSIANS